MPPRALKYQGRGGWPAEVTVDRGEVGRCGGSGDYLVGVGEGGGPDVDGVTAHFRGMLTLGDTQPPEDWGILKDFLGFRLPHERDTENGEVTVQRSVAQFHTQNSARIILDSPEDLGAMTPAASSSHGLFSSPLSVPSPPDPLVGAQALPLPPINTLVRCAAPPSTSPGCPPGSGVPPLGYIGPVDLSNIKTEFSQDGGTVANTVDCCTTSAFRSVVSMPSSPNTPTLASSSTPSSVPVVEYTLAEAKASPSLLRDLLVLGKPPLITTSSNTPTPAAKSPPLHDQVL